MYFTLWEGPAPVVCRLGDSSGILPWWGGGLRYVTTWEESAHVRHIAGWESDIVPCGKGVCGTHVCCVR